MTDSLSELREFVMEKRWPLFDWIVEHAPDGTLDRVWREDEQRLSTRWRLDILVTLYNRSAGHDRRVFIALAGMLAAALAPSSLRNTLKKVVRTHADPASLDALTLGVEPDLRTAPGVFCKFIEKPQLVTARLVAIRVGDSDSPTYNVPPGDARDAAMARGLVAAVPAPTLAELFDAADRGSP